MTRELHDALLSVTVYKNIVELPPVEALSRFLSKLEEKDWEGALDAYTDVLYQLCQAGHSSLADYLGEHLRYDKAPYPEAAAEGRVTPVLEQAARRDIRAFRLAASASCGDLKEALANILPPERRGLDLAWWESGEAPTFEELTEFYVQNGAGLFSRYRAFLWEDGRLHPVADPDFVPAEELVGYDRQRNQVIANTRALAAGEQVNNVLLYGESGTGKSAAVKALLGVKGLENLRLIEIHKDDLGGMPDLIRMLGHRPQKFVLFIDDLAFDKDDKTYSVLKTILEGGLEKRPANVAVYATSNRRHLVRETFSDRAGDEVDASETIQEKTSLSERFGLRIPFLALNRREFMDLVEKLARLSGVSMEREKLLQEAVKWEMHHPSRTPRTARQFIASLHV